MINSLFNMIRGWKKIHQKIPLEILICVSSSVYWLPNICDQHLAAGIKMNQKIIVKRIIVIFHAIFISLRSFLLRKTHCICFLEATFRFCRCLFSIIQTVDSWIQTNTTYQFIHSLFIWVWRMIGVRTKIDNFVIYLLLNWFHAVEKNDSGYSKLHIFKNSYRINLSICHCFFFCLAFCARH